MDGSDLPCAQSLTHSDDCIMLLLAPIPSYIIHTGCLSLNKCTPQINSTD